MAPTQPPNIRKRNKKQHTTVGWSRCFTPERWFCFSLTLGLVTLRNKLLWSLAPQAVPLSCIGSLLERRSTVHQSSSTFCTLRLLWICKSVSFKSSIDLNRGSKLYSLSALLSFQDAQASLVSQGTSDCIQATSPQQWWSLNQGISGASDIPSPQKHQSHQPLDSLATWSEAANRRWRPGTKTPGTWKRGKVSKSRASTVPWMSFDEQINKK